MPPRHLTRRPLAAVTHLTVLVIATVAWLVPVTTITAAPAAATDSAERTGNRPNIVVVMADDMRSEELRWMPNVRRVLRRNGVEFKNGFAPFPLCCPSRASFLTGRYPHNHDVWWHRAPYGYGSFDDSSTLATALKARGYRTGFIGKYLNGYSDHRSKVSGGPSLRYVPRGWDDWRAGVNRNNQVSGALHSYMNTAYNINGRLKNFKGEYQTFTLGRMARRMTDRFSASGKPFFMYVSFLAPHRGGPRWRNGFGEWVYSGAGGHRWRLGLPFVPKRWRGRFDHAISKGAGVRHPGARAEPNLSDKPYWIKRRPELTNRDHRALRLKSRQRAAAIWLMDRQIRTLVKRLKATGEWRNTIFVFTSDNGFYLGEHRVRSGKVLQHEESLRVPILITGPGMRKGARRFAPASTIDISKSILHAAGASLPHPVDGRSLLPIARWGDQSWHRAVLLENHRPGPVRNKTRFADPVKRTLFADTARAGAGVRTARYSFMMHRKGRDELYDLWRDPFQLWNRNRNGDYAAVKKRLRRLTVELADCAGPECNAAVPQGLRVGTRKNRNRTVHYYGRLRDRYFSPR